MNPCDRDEFILQTTSFDWEVGDIIHWPTGNECWAYLLVDNSTPQPEAITLDQKRLELIHLRTDPGDWHTHENAFARSGLSFERDL